MFSISRHFVGLEDTKLKSGVEVKGNEKRKSIDLPIWVEELKSKQDLVMDYSELDKPLFKK